MLCLSARTFVCAITQCRRGLCRSHRSHCARTEARALTPAGRRVHTHAVGNFSFIGAHNLSLYIRRACAPLYTQLNMLIDISVTSARRLCVCLSAWTRMMIAQTIASLRFRSKSAAPPFVGYICSNVSGIVSQPVQLSDLWGLRTQSR